MCEGIRSSERLRGDSSDWRTITAVVLRVCGEDASRRQEGDEENEENCDEDCQLRGRMGRKERRGYGKGGRKRGINTRVWGGRVEEGRQGMAGREGEEMKGENIKEAKENEGYLRQG